MQRFVTEHTDFQKVQGNVSKHVALMSELSEIIGKRNLMELSMVGGADAQPAAVVGARREGLPALGRCWLLFLLLRIFGLTVVSLERQRCGSGGWVEVPSTQCSGVARAQGAGHARCRCAVTDPHPDTHGHGAFMGAVSPAPATAKLQQNKVSEPAAACPASKLLLHPSCASVSAVPLWVPDSMPPTSPPA